MAAVDTKRDQIIEKAILRFSHFGIQKTTMNEIAEDLSISKPLLYYYFPDKFSLIVAVVEKVVEEYQTRVRALFNESSDLKESIFAMLELRSEFLQRYFMLHLLDPAEIPATKQKMRPTINRILENEIDLLKTLFKRAIEQKQLKVRDLDKTTELFVDVMGGVNYCVLSRHEKSLMPEAAVFLEVVDRQKELTEIFLKGVNQLP